MCVCDVRTVLSEYICVDKKGTFTYASSGKSKFIHAITIIIVSIVIVIINTVIVIISTVIVIIWQPINDVDDNLLVVVCVEQSHELIGSRMCQI